MKQTRLRPTRKGEKEVDMGNPFDFFGEISHPDCKEITAEQFENRTKQSCLSSACLLYFFQPVAPNNRLFH
jgi:D-alanyl-D-alanine dipeptidase